MALGGVQRTSVGCKVWRIPAAHVAQNAACACLQGCSLQFVAEELRHNVVKFVGQSAAQQQRWQQESQRSWPTHRDDTAPTTSTSGQAIGATSPCCYSVAMTLIAPALPWLWRVQCSALYGAKSRCILH